MKERPIRALLFFCAACPEGRVSRQDASACRRQRMARRRIASIGGRHARSQPVPPPRPRFRPAAVGGWHRAAPCGMPGPPAVPGLRLQGRAGLSRPRWPVRRLSAPLSGLWQPAGQSLHLRERARHRRESGVRPVAPAQAPRSAGRGDAAGIRACGVSRLPRRIPFTSVRRNSRKSAACFAGCRSVAQLVRAPVSKTGGWGFESLHSCHSRRQPAREADGHSHATLYATGLAGYRPALPH